MTDQYGRSYGEWIGDLFRNPVSGGAKGCFFYLVAFPIMIVSGFVGLSMFPPGTYPMVLLIAPGVVVAAVALSLYGYVVYRLPAFFAIFISIPLVAIGWYFLWLFAGGLIRQFLSAI